RHTLWGRQGCGRSLGSDGGLPVARGVARVPRVSDTAVFRTRRSGDPGGFSGAVAAAGQYSMRRTRPESRLYGRGGGRNRQHRGAGACTGDAGVEGLFAAWGQSAVRGPGQPRLGATGSGSVGAAVAGTRGNLGASSVSRRRIVDLRGR